MDKKNKDKSKEKEICICKYPKILIDDDGEYIAFPSGSINGNRINVPNIIEYNVSGEKFYKVAWKEPNGQKVKNFNIQNGHIATIAKDCPEGSLNCKYDDVYSVLHPEDEWLNDHVTDKRRLKNNGEKKK